MNSNLCEHECKCERECEHWGSPLENVLDYELGIVVLAWVLHNIRKAEYRAKHQEKNSGKPVIGNIKDLWGSELRMYQNLEIFCTDEPKGRYGKFVRKLIMDYVQKKVAPLLLASRIGQLSGMFVCFPTAGNSQDKDKEKKDE